MTRKSKLAKPEELSFVSEVATEGSIENSRCSSLYLSTHVDDLEDFEKYNNLDLVYREYEPIGIYSSDGYHQMDDCGLLHWKTGRSTNLSSWCMCIVYSFLFNVLGGIIVGIFATTLMWIDLNSSELCYDYNDKFYEMPLKIQQTRITTQVFKFMVIQSWHFYCILFVFGWPVIKEVNLLSWNMLASFSLAIYRLFLYTYEAYDSKWSTYLPNALFASMAMFNGFRVAVYHIRSKFKKRLTLAFKLTAQFYIGVPIALIFSYLVIPYYKTLSQINKVILASLAPVIILIPKAIIRISAERLTGVNHPGTSILLLLPFQIGATVMFRVLQADLQDWGPFFILCVIYGLAGALDKITLPIREFFYYNCCLKRCKILTQLNTPRINRLYADLTITSMVLEGASIFLSCATFQVFRYYYSARQSEDAYRLFLDFLSRVALTIIVEFIFSVISIKIQTYYYNIPVMRVWNIKWRWLLAIILLNVTVAVLYFADILFDAVRSRKMYNQGMTRKCVGSFQRP